MTVASVDRLSAERHHLGIRAFQLYFLVSDAVQLSYEEARKVLGFTDQEMEDAYLIMAEALRLYRANRLESVWSSVSRITQPGDPLETVLNP